MTITIQLDGPGLAALQQEAANLGVSVEQLADTIIQRHVRGRAGLGPVVDEATFRKAMADTFRENEELYRRLAR
jgi:hypothetical protein